jgi:Ulp1 family protease
LDRLSRRTERLNDVNVNSGALLLQHLFHQAPSAAQCAIFLSFDIYLARYDQPTNEVWRRTEVTEYWNKAIWIIPVFRDVLEHWVVAVVYPSARRILFYDSLAYGLADCQETLQVTYPCAFGLWLY